MTTNTTLRNDDLIKTLSTDYVKLFAPTTSWGNIVSMNLGYPALRGYWPMNSADENDDIYDLSGQGRTLTHYP